MASKDNSSNNNYSNDYGKFSYADAGVNSQGNVWMRTEYVTPGPDRNTYEYANGTHQKASEND